MEAIARRNERTISINGKTIELPASIRHGIIFQNIFVVVLDAYYSMRNVFAFDEEGNQIWTIEEPDFEVKGVGYALVDGDGGKLMALCRGVQFFIDPKTGKIYDSYFDK
ncbi:hypothetical protein [Bdellovibrio sp.]|uniref:hypothetical protein n=1 Tax=Bdellovibrio sp. TaxID=28201 RepID=UPI0039E45E21